MRASSSFKAVLGLALALTLALPCLAGAASLPGRTQAAGVGSSGGHLLAQAWSWLRSLWPEEGCGIDPSGGKCASQSPAPPVRPDEGCGIDPNGKCQMTPARSGT
jgi:hypothetical protein